MHRIKKSAARTDLILEWKKIGHDHVVCLTGGDEHVGAVAVGYYDIKSKRASSSVITSPGHRETELALFGARVISKAGKSTSVFIAGIHLEDIIPEEIEEIVSVAERMIDELSVIIQEVC
ncbi:MAG: hypothetical protein QCH31_00860 [Methanolobus sp.]|nr:hypothetical protein [Methanolobus sp.]